MLNDHELECLMDRHAVPKNGRDMVRLIRSEEPSRRVRSGKKSVSCRYASRKMGVVIQAESHTNELSAVYLWDHDEVSREFYDQPRKIQIEVEGPPRRLLHPTVDFFLIQDEFIGWVECKTEEHLLKLAKKRPGFFVKDGGVWRCPPGEKYAAQFGLGFRVESSVSHNRTLERNVKFLSDYLHAEMPDGYIEAIARLRAMFNGSSSLRLCELIEVLEPPDIDQLYHAIARSDIYVDLTAQVLAKPTRATVFPHKDVASAYSVHQRALAAAHPDLKPTFVRKEPNSVVTWDSVQYRILSLGHTKIFMQSISHCSVVGLSYEDFDSMVVSGVIQGEESDSSQALRRSVEEIIQNTSSEDLEIARQRLNYLEQATAGVHTTQVKARTARHWRKLANDATAAFGDPIIGLIPQTAKRGNRYPKIQSDVYQTITEVATRDYMTANATSFAACFGAIRNECKAIGARPPCETTVRKHFQKLFSPKEAAVARQGEKAAYKLEPFFEIIEQSTPRHGDRPFEIAHIDHTQIDVHLVDENGADMGRPWLTLMIDAYSRTVLAYVIMYSNPNSICCSLLLRECIRKHHRVPSTIVVDNGKEFGSTHFERLLASLCVTKKSRPPSKSRFGSVMERFFGVADNIFFHNLAGNSKATKVPRAMSASHNPLPLAVWTLDELIPTFDDFLETTYHATKHSALGSSPTTVLREGMRRTGARAMRQLSMDLKLEILFLPIVKKGTAAVDPRKGIKVNYQNYWHDSMVHCEDLVEARYDPLDASYCYAFIKGKWHRCNASNRHQFFGLTPLEILVQSLIQAARHSRTTTDRLERVEAQGAGYIRYAQKEAVLKEQRKIKLDSAQDDVECETYLVANRTWSNARIGKIEVLK